MADRKLEDIAVIGANHGLSTVLKQVGQVARLDTSVLLLGETGVGKGLIAALIHNMSLRIQGPFITVNCGAIPDTLLDSELFGHEKGAFTGAVLKKQGRFERANNGTLFLDEIAELPLSAQVRLLNVLQNREIERVGGSSFVSLNIRVISATNKDLESMVGSGRFRKDLWFRLNVFPIQIPPLRHRKEDIPDLTSHFIRKTAEKLKLDPIPRIGQNALEQLMAYHWPGNVRELENMVERAMICCKWGQLDFTGILPQFVPIPGTPVDDESMAFYNRIAAVHDISQVVAVGAGPEKSFLSLNQVNRIHISNALASAKGKINGPGGAAQLLQIHPNTLRKRMDRLGIQYGKKRARSMSRS